MELIEKEKNLSKRYELKTEKIIYRNNEEETIVKLTPDNVAMVEAMISTDSDYRDSLNIEKGPKYKRNGEIKYIGSSRYWINKLKDSIDIKKDELSNESFKYENIIKNIIISIDNENSTHLNSDWI